MPGLLGGLRREMGSEHRPTQELVREALQSHGLLVLDDLGAEKATEWSMGVLFELVAARHDRREQILITSNLTPRRLADAGYERIVSRIADEGCLVEMRSAHDYRMRHLRVAAGPEAEPAASSSQPP